MFSSHRWLNRCLSPSAVIVCKHSVCMVVSDIAVVWLEEVYFFACLFLVNMHEQHHSVSWLLRQVKSFLAVCQIFSISFVPLVLTGFVNRGPYGLLYYSGGQHLTLKIFLQFYINKAIQIQLVFYIHHYISEFYHSRSMSFDRSCSFQLTRQ